MAVALCVAGTVLQLAGALSAVKVRGARILGVALATPGIAIVSFAQFALADAWRIGVDPTERTELVTDGPFSLVMASRTDDGEGDPRQTAPARGDRLRLVPTELAYVDPHARCLRPSQSGDFL